MLRLPFTPVLSALALGLPLALPASAQVWDEPLADEDNIMKLVPDEVVGSGVIQRVNNQVPLDHIFVDEFGAEVALTDVFAGDLPVLLTLHYSDCPQLCSMVLNGVVDTLQDVELEIGEHYLADLEHHASGLAGRSIHVQWTIKGEGPPASSQAPRAAERPPDEVPEALGLNTDQTFHNFVVGPCNSFAHAACAAAPSCATSSPRTESTATSW